MNSSINFSENIFKILYSIIFRLLLLMLSTLILYRFDNYFKWPIYLVAFFVYASIYMFSRLELRPLNKNKEKQEKFYFIVRILNDFLLVNLVLYGKGLDNFLNVSFLFLLLLNTPNHTKGKISIIPFILTVWTFFYLSISCKNNCSTTSYSLERVYFIFKSESISILAILMAYFTIIMFENFRSRIKIFHIEATSLLDDFIINKKKSQPSSDFYIEIIKKFNSSKFKEYFTINDIFCLSMEVTKENTLDEKNIILENSQNFILDYSISNLNPINSWLKKKEATKLINGCKVIINKKNLDKNIVIPIKAEGGKKILLYVLDIYQTNHILNSTAIRDIFFGEMICSFFIKLDSYFENESQIKKQKVENFKKIKGEYDYVMKTINTMHFLRNRLTPIKNYISITQYFDTFLSFNESNSVLKEIYLNERKIALAAMNEFLNRASQILEGENPFNVSTLNDYSFQTLYNEIRELCFAYFHNNKMENNLPDEFFHKIVRFNYHGLRVVLTDIIANISKYSYEGKYSIRFYLNDDTSLNCIIENDVLITNDRIGFYTESIEYLNSKERYGIFKRKQKGLFLIKDFLFQMEIPIEVNLLKVDSTKQLYKYSTILNFKIHE